MGNLVDLFAGSCSVANVAKKRGWDTITTDIEPFEGIDVVKDIFKVTDSDFQFDKRPWWPDVVWASPPCTFFSVGSIGKHWNKDHTPKTEEAEYGMSIIHRMLGVMAMLKIHNPNMIWFIENPRGKLRKLPMLANFPRHTVCYCQYGDTRMKPTDIWTNCKTWKPRPMCFNGNTDCHHEASPRGSKSGTQGLKNAFEKSKIPTELIEEILDACGTMKL